MYNMRSCTCINTPALTENNINIMSLADDLLNSSVSPNATAGT